MIARQLASRGVRDGRVLAAMAWTPREWFLPPHLARNAYDDGPLGADRLLDLGIALQLHAQVPDGGGLVHRHHASLVFPRRGEHERAM